MCSTSATHHNSLSLVTIPTVTTIVFYLTILLPLEAVTNRSKIKYVDFLPKIGTVIIEVIVYERWNRSDAVKVGRSSVEISIFI